MKTRLYKDEDYETLKPWWVKHWGEAPSPHVIPSCGLILGDVVGDVAAAWLAQDNSCGMAMVVWMVANPKNTHSTTHEGLEKVIKGLVEIAKSQGRQVIMVACPQGGMSKLFQKCGFKLNDTNMHNLTKFISCSE
jgi:hypothetical protein